MQDDVGKPQQDKDAIIHEMARVCSEERAQVAQAAPPLPPKEIPAKEVVEAYYNSEDGDGYLFVRAHQGKWVYDYALERWYHFTGHGWELDEVGQVVAEVQAVIELYLKASVSEKEAAALAGKEHNDQLVKSHDELAGKLLDRARKLQGLARKKKVLELARSGTGTLGIDGKQWDIDPWVLGCPNGVIDLRTGHMRPGTPEDFIKTVCPTPYKGPDEPCPIWDKFLRDSLNDDDELISYVQRLFGYAILGLHTEHILPILQGQGRNGKGTILETFHYLLGPLAGPIDSEMLLDQYQHRSAAAPSPDIVDLRGKRIVWASETDEGRKLSLSRVKWLTGGDTLKGRPPNGKVMIEFSPTHTLFLLTNPLPHAPGDDYALWERLRIIHFPFSFVDEPKADNERVKDAFLPEKLKGETSGILAWLVRGCLLWQRDGLGSAASIQVATQEYKGGEDLIGQFIDECTVPLPNSSVSATALYQAYVRWCKASGLNPKTNTWFGKAAKRRLDWHKQGFVEYLGIALVHQEEPKQEKLS